MNPLGEVGFAKDFIINGRFYSGFYLNEVSSDADRTPAHCPLTRRTRIKAQGKPPKPVCHPQQHQGQQGGGQ